MTLPAETDIRGALAGVIDPELGDSVVDLGMVKAIAVQQDGKVTVTVALTTAGCPLRAQFMKDVRARVGGVRGVTKVIVKFSEMTKEQKRSLMDRARFKAQERSTVAMDLAPNARVAAIASGKGGVGKSTVTANLAVGLAARGFKVGVLDADIGGFSMPRLLGVDGKVEAEKAEDDRVLITPIEKKIGEGLLRVVSMGAIEGAEEDEAVMLRGLMLNRALQHFLEDVKWGDVDYLLIDMPPGTSDIQMGLARMLPRTEVIIVTTPAIAAQQVASRAADMARKGYLRVVGVVENMSAFVAPDGASYALFGEGGGKRLARKLGVPLLGQLPLDAEVARGGDAGTPAVLGSGPAARAYNELLDVLVDDALPPISAGCSAIDALEALLPKS
ncbi:MAG TPA: P-loop NTPase [Acidimicrobiales bacterium]|nr:P-loop NTPase [Acidimicrobiales bacterium]